MCKDKMICDICGEEVKPLDAHMGYIDSKLALTHIDCWNTLNIDDPKPEYSDTVKKYIKEK